MGLKKSTLIFLTLSSLLYSCQSAGKTSDTSNYTIATGVGQIVDNDIGRAKDDALIDAKKIAVQQVLGSLVKGRSSSESGTLQYSSIISKTDGFIEKYEIIKMGSVSKIEYQVKIKAIVNKAKIKETIEEALRMKGQPRMMFLIHELYIDGTLTNYTSDALEERFVSRGFPVVDKSIAHKIVKQEKERVSNSLSVRRLKKIKVDSGAEVLVVGSATIKNAGKVMNTRMNSIQISVSVKVVDANTAKILASAQDHSASVHINESTGSVNAAKIVAQKLSKKLIKDIMKKWQANNTSTISVLISDISYSQLRNLRGELLGLRGVQAVNRKGFTGNIAKLEVVFTGNSGQLADRVLDRRKIFVLSVKEAKSNYIHFQRMK